MTTTRQLPDIAEILGTLLQRAPEAEQPLLLALAERVAADMYRDWANQVGHEKRKALLLACAAREEQIANGAEALYPTAASIQRDLVARIPDLKGIRSLFDPLPLDDQFRLLANGERAGGSAWRAYAEKAADAKMRQVFSTFAPLEEANAACLESILAEQA